MGNRTAWLRRGAFVPGGLVLLAFVVWRVSRLPGWQLFGELVDRVDTPERVVALTFDDGPLPGGTSRVLEQLDALDVKATFFLVGKNIEQFPDAARAIIRAGHQLGNHSYLHHRLVFVTPATVRREIERTDAAIRALGYAAPLPFRAPFGKKLVVLPWVLAQDDRLHVTWDVAPDGDLTATADDIVDQVMEQVRPGSIVLLHVMPDSRAASRQAVGPIVAGLRARGYRFVTVAELLGLRHTNN